MGKSQGSPYGGVFKGPSSDGSPTGLRKTISLQDIPSSSAIDSLSIHQMKALLAKYNRKPENYVMRQDLIYEVRLLWNQAKRQALEQQNGWSHDFCRFVYPFPCSVIIINYSCDLLPTAIDDTKIFAVGPRSTQTLPSRKWKSQDCLDDDHVDPGFHRSGSQYLRQAQGNVDTRKPKMEHYDLVLRDDIFPPPPPHLMTPLDEPFNRGPEYATLPRNYKIPVSNMQPGLRYGGTEPIQQSVVSKTPKAPPPPPPPLPKTAPPVSHKQIQQPQQQQKSFPMKSALSISLQDIHSLEDIASLSLRQMIHILENHSVNTDGIDEKPYLQQMVTQLWHNKRSGKRSPLIKTELLSHDFGHDILSILNQKCNFFNIKLENIWVISLIVRV